MSEMDVREIIKKFNDSLNKYCLEKTELEKKIQQVIDKIDDKR
jgi:hypothetical protein